MKICPLILAGGICSRRRPEQWQNQIFKRGDRLWGDPTFGGKGSALNQILRPIQRFPKRLKSARIIAFAFFLDGGVSEAAYRRTKAFDRLIPEMQGFRQSMFQDFALRIEGLLGRWRNRNVCHLAKN